MPYLLPSRTTTLVHESIAVAMASCLLGCNPPPTMKDRAATSPQADPSSERRALAETPASSTPPVQEPDHRPVSVEMRDILFGDAPWDQWPREDNEYGGIWDSFRAARSAVEAGDLDDAKLRLHQIIDTPDLESLHYVQAWHFLRELGEEVPDYRADEVLGVIVEVALDEGLDLVAAYKDRNARYYNHANGGVVLPSPSDRLLEVEILAILDAGAGLVEHASVSESGRPPPPRSGNVRVNALTPAGLVYSEAPLDILAADPIGGLVFSRAFDLLEALMTLAERSAP